MNKEFLKYRYLGEVSAAIPEPWKPIVLQMLVDIDKIIRPWYMPRSILNKRQESRRKRNKERRMANLSLEKQTEILNEDIYITQIKEKFASLRVSGTFTPEIKAIVLQTMEDCANTCEFCGAPDPSIISIKGWVRNLCIECKQKAKQ